MKILIKEEWWLDWDISLDNQFVDVFWARIQVFDDSSAEVFDVDGRTIYFEEEASAALELLEDEYIRFAHLDAEDKQDLGKCLSNLKPPNINEKENLKSLMKVRLPCES